MVKKKKVAVIGGGVSGLAAAKVFRERGHEVRAFERSGDLGGVWAPSRSYPGVQTQSPKELYRFTDMAMPEDYPQWPKGPQVHAYLHGYAERHDLKPLYRMNAGIRAMTRRPDGAPGWRLAVEDAAGAHDEDYDFVAVCTGQFSEKNIISHPGQAEFETAGGQVLHSSEYTDPALARGKRVVVLGFSKSATDLAVNAADNGAESVTIVYRQPCWRVPYYIAGINFKNLLYMRAQEIQFNGWGGSPLGKLAFALSKPLIWANFRGLESLLKLQLGLKRHDMVPDTPIEREASCSLPIVTPGFFEHLDSGRITAIRGSFDHYDGGAIVMTGGERVAADLSLLAVGWKLGVPYLDDAYRRKLIEDDGQYRIYRLCVNPDLPDMGFVGFNSSFCTMLSAEMGANWLVRYADGMLANQPDKPAMDADIEANLRWRRTQRPAAQVYGGLCSAPFHFRHFDELLADMGAARRKRRNLLAEYFAPPNADAFAEFLASAPQYRAA